MADPRNTDDLAALVQARVDAAYETGFRAGHEAAVAAFVTAAQTFAAPGFVLTPNPTILGSAGAPRRSKAEVRAPRGQVAEAIREALTEEPGIRVVEVMERVTARYPKIAAKSVGNQMRRGEGTAYERVGKYAWYLKGQAPKADTAGWPDWAKPAAAE